MLRRNPTPRRAAPHLSARSGAGAANAAARPWRRRAAAQRISSRHTAQLTPRCTVSQRVLSALDESCRTCTHGTNHDHYLVTLGESMKLEAFAAGVSAGVLFASSDQDRSSAERFEVNAHFSAGDLSITEITATHEAVEAIAADERIDAIECDCVIQLDPFEASDEAAEASVGPSGNGTGAESAAAFSGAADGFQGPLSSGLWGLDRIDRKGFGDGGYSYGAATGQGVRVYVLDTGCAPFPTCRDPSPT